MVISSYKAINHKQLERQEEVNDEEGEKEGNQP